jgi:hypothetical protein
MATKIHSSYDRGSGIDRRCISYVAHIPERRSGRDRRVSGERRKDLMRKSQRSSTWRELYEPDGGLAD